MYRNNVIDVKFDIDTKATGVRLNQLRTEKNFSCEAIAEGLGVSTRAVTYWESGQKNFSVKNLVGLSLILGVKTDDILCLKIAEDIVFIRGFPIESPAPICDN